MSDLKQKVTSIRMKYQILKKCENVQQKMLLSEQIQGDCFQCQNKLKKTYMSTQIFIWMRSINEIKNKALEINQSCYNQLNVPQRTSQQFFSNEVNLIIPNSIKSQISDEDELSRNIVRSIIFEQLSSKQIQVTVEELQQLAAKMEQNLQIMQEIQNIIEQNSDHLEVLYDNISKIFENVQDSNNELKNAAQTQFRTRILKIRLGISGILGSLGLFFLGIPGAILATLCSIKIGKGLTKSKK